MISIPTNIYEINSINPIFYIPYIAVVLTIAIIKMFFQDIFIDRQRKKKRNEFVAFLRSNQSIDYYIKQYGQIGFFERKWSAIYLDIGIALGFIIPSLPFFIFSRIYEENELTNAIALKFMVFSITITLSLAFLSIVLIKKDSIYNIDNNKFIDKYVSFANKFTLIEFYVISSYLIILLLFTIIFLNLSQVLNLNLIIQFLLIYDLALLLFIPIGIFNQKQYFKSYLKDILNSNGSKFFPYLNVRTKENLQIDGTIKDIFNDKFLILEDKGIKKVTLWDSVSTLEINEGKIRDLTLQKKLQDFT